MTGVPHDANQARARVVFGTDLAHQPTGTANPLEELASIIAFASNDWGSDRAGAALHAIITGWGCDENDPGHVHDDIACGGPDGAWAYVATQHQWSPEYVTRLKTLHARYLQLRTAANTPR